jgi:hypothetical protein
MSRANLIMADPSRLRSSCIVAAGSASLCATPSRLVGRNSPPAAAHPLLTKAAAAGDRDLRVTIGLERLPDRHSGNGDRLGCFRQQRGLSRRGGRRLSRGTSDRVSERQEFRAFRRFIGIFRSYSDSCGSELGLPSGWRLIR